MKAGNVWRLTDDAARHGVQSTTRYRKHGTYRKLSKTETPALIRQRSGSRGGKASRKYAMRKISNTSGSSLSRESSASASQASQASSPVEAQQPLQPQLQPQSQSQSEPQPQPQSQPTQLSQQQFYGIPWQQFNYPPLMTSTPMHGLARPFDGQAIDAPSSFFNPFPDESDIFPSATPPLIQMVPGFGNPNPGQKPEYFTNTSHPRNEFSFPNPNPYSSGFAAYGTGTAGFNDINNNNHLNNDVDARADDTLDEHDLSSDATISMPSPSARGESLSPWAKDRDEAARERDMKLNAQSGDGITVRMSDVVKNASLEEYSEIFREGDLEAPAEAPTKGEGEGDGDKQ